MPRDRSTLRRVLIRRFLSEQEISNQSDLTRLLREAGHPVTQSTVSRDLSELGATKIDEGTKHERYALGDTERVSREELEQLRRALEDYLEGVTPSGNLVVLKVRAATAGPVAAAIDSAPMEDVIGTIAGDDTVLVVSGSPNGGSQIGEQIMKLMEA